VQGISASTRRFEPVVRGLCGSALLEDAPELGHIAPPHLRRREARVFDEFTQRKGTQDIHPLRGIQVAESDPVVIAAAQVSR